MYRRFAFANRIRAIAPLALCLAVAVGCVPERNGELESRFYEARKDYIDCSFRRFGEIVLQAENVDELPNDIVLSKRIVADCAAERHKALSIFPFDDIEWAINSIDDQIRGEMASITRAARRLKAGGWS